MNLKKKLIHAHLHILLFANNILAPVKAQLKGFSRARIFSRVIKIVLQLYPQYYPEYIFRI